MIFFGDIAFKGKRWPCLLLALICSGAFPFRAAAEVRVETAADPTDIFLGEAIILNVQISDYTDGMEPDLSALPGAVTLLGQRDESRQSITIINGRRQVTGFSGRLFQYRVMPAAAGTQRLGPVRVSASGKVITSTPGPTINVRPVPRQDTVLLLLESTKQKVIIDESFTIALRILVRRLKPPYADASPLPEQAPPFLSIPYLDQNDDDGLDSEDIRERLNRMLTNSGAAFRINNFTVGSGAPFGGMFGNGREARFRFDRQEVMHNGEPYYEYRFPVQVTPRREGAFSFGPVVFKGPVFVNVTPAGEGQAETIYAIAEPIAVRATPPPRENRTAAYIGAIGSNLTVNASLDAQTCYIGDPLTLTLEIRTDGRLDAITAPRLGAQPALQRDFRIYEDTVQRESGEDYRRYRFTVRPSRTGTLEFPPVAVSFYDTTAADYRTVYTEPLPVRVNAVTEVQRDMVIDTGTQSITIRDADDRLPAAPVEMAGSLTAVTPFFTARLHLPLLLAGPLCYLGVLLMRLRRRLAPALIANRRRQRAAAHAIRQLRCQPDASGASPPLPGPVLRGYLEVRLGPTFKSATPPECERLLLAADVAPDLARRFSRCLETCTLAAFAQPAPQETDNAALRREAASLVAELDNALRKQPRRRTGRQWARLAFLLVLPGVTMLPCNAHPAGSRSEDFEAQRTTTFLLAAAQPEDFAQAAEALAALVDNGAANATLFYNYGTALLMAGDADTALEALARAERYSGTTWGLRRNMRLARRAQDPDAPASRPWQRIPLFWHYRLPAATRLTVAAGAFSAIWLLAIWRRSRRHAFVLPAIWFATAICLLFGASVLTSIHAEYEAALNHVQRQTASRLVEHES